ncbi:MAG TPA: hypothetical protein VEK15_06440, partial [Vicinamibacteria bacterium]|nr:hypothetical protein [Vicinamibacteria bacterium]
EVLLGTLSGNVVRGSITETQQSGNCVAQETATHQFMFSTTGYDGSIETSETVLSAPGTCNISPPPPCYDRLVMVGERCVGCVPC